MNPNQQTCCQDVYKKEYEKYKERGFKGEIKSNTWTEEQVWIAMLDNGSTSEYWAATTGTKITQGVGVNQRIGNKIQPLYADFTVLLQWDFDQAVTATSVDISYPNLTARSTEIIVALVMDRQPVWDPTGYTGQVSAPDPTAVYTMVGDMDVYPNINNEGRFDILYEKKITMGWLTNNMKILRDRVDLTDYEVAYNNIDESSFPSSNALFLYIFAPYFNEQSQYVDEGFGVLVTPSITLRYTDI